MDRKGGKVGSAIGRWFLTAIGLHRHRPDEEATAPFPTDVAKVPDEPERAQRSHEATRAEVADPYPPTRVRAFVTTRVSDRDEYLIRVTRGVSTGFDQPRAGPVEQIVIGLDFGTSASKIALRAPYSTSSPTHAVPIPQSLRSEGNPHLCSTTIWFLPSGEFTLWKVEDAVRVDGIKIALMSNHPQTPIAYASSGLSVCAIDACIAYLAYLFRYARGWFFEVKGEAYGYRPIAWMTNVGLPAATYDNVPLLALYRQCVAAAWLLSLSNVEISIETVREAYRDQRSLCAATNKPEGRESLGIEVIPEVVAEVTGFARSPHRRDGLYILVDVGAATLDACSFRLYAPNGDEDRYSMFTADVQLLGVEPVQSRQQAGESDVQLRGEIARVAKSVIWDTKRHRDPHAAEFKGELPVFLCGGGSGNDIHKHAVKELTDWFARYVVGARLRFLSLESPENLEALTDPGDFHRLAVAAGLSHPTFDIGTLTPPSDIEDMPGPRIRNYDGALITKDQV